MLVRFILGEAQAETLETLHQILPGSLLVLSRLSAPEM